jgi:hypothetical protein
MYLYHYDTNISHGEDMTLKEINKLGFMSLMALLGFIGIFSENKGFLGFFGFLCYARYFTVIPDELFKQFVRRSASIGFFTGTGTTALAIAFLVLLEDIFTPVAAFAAGFVVSIIAFTIALIYFEYEDQQGVQA